MLTSPAFSIIWRSGWRLWRPPYVVLETRFIGDRIKVTERGKARTLGGARKIQRRLQRAAGVTA